MVALVTIQQEFQLFLYEIEIDGVIQQLETLLNARWLSYEAQLRPHQGFLRLVALLFDLPFVFKEDLLVALVLSHSYSVLY